MQQKALKEQLSGADRRSQHSSKAKAAAARDLKAAKQALHETERQAWPLCIPCCMLKSSTRSNAVM